MNDPVENKQSSTEADQANKYDGDLLKIIAIQSELAAADLDPQAIMNLIAQRAKELVDADGASVSLLEGDALVLKAGSGQGFPPIGQRISLAHSLSGLSIRTASALRSDDTANDPRIDPHVLSMVHPRSLIAVPFQAGAEILGSLGVIAHQPNAFTDRDLQLLRLAVGVMSAAIRHSLEHEALLAANAAQRESEYKYRTLINEASDAILISNVAGVFVEVNSAACALLGYSREELLLIGPTDIIAQKDQALAQSLTAAMSDDNTSRVEINLRNKDGAIVTVEASSKRLDDGGLFTIARDISSRKAVEAELLAERQRFQAVFDNSHDGLLILNDQGEVLTANAASARIAGIPQERLLGLTYRDFYPASQVALVDQLWSDLLAKGEIKGEIRSQVEGQESHDIEYYDKANIMPGYHLAVIKDVTARKKIEHNLEHERDLLHSLLNNTSDRIYFKDRQSRFTRASKSMADQFGLADPADAIGLSDFDFFGAEHANQAYQDEQEIMLTGHPIIRKLELETWPDGHETWALTSKMPLRNLEGEIEGTLGISVDMTDSHRADAERVARLAAEEANRAKNEFLSRMSHELRTPLNAILGFGQLLEMEVTEPGQRESVELIVSAGRHLLGLINEVLDITGIEQGGFGLLMEPIKISDVLDECLNMLAPLAQQRGIRFNAVLPDVCNNYVRADRQRLRQVLLNLLSNAIKYNREGGQVTICCEFIDQAARKGKDPQRKTVGSARSHVAADILRVTLKDTGRGIAADKLNRLFVPFERLGAEQGEVEGTGLGLTVCKLLIEAMGGAIGADSVYEQGASFWFELPVALGPA